MLPAALDRNYAGKEAITVRALDLDGRGPIRNRTVADLPFVVAPPGPDRAVAFQPEGMIVPA